MSKLCFPHRRLRELLTDAVFWVIITFVTAAVQTPHQLYALRFLVSTSCQISYDTSPSLTWHQVGLAEGTFYPAVHTVLGGWYTKQGAYTRQCLLCPLYLTSSELAKRACIFFASAFVGSMFSGYLVRTLPPGHPYTKG